MAAMPSQSYMPSYDPYAAPVVSPAYEMNPYGAMPMPTYVQPPQYMPYPPYPQYVPAYQPQPPYYGGVPYQPPYQASYPPVYPGYVQGAYTQFESSAFMQPHHHAPYESSSLQMPLYDPSASATSPAYDPNMPPALSPYAPQEDCGCSDPQPSYPYAPQPGGPYGAPYYPSYQPTPYTPYAPQPGMPYYRPAQTSMFGTPDIDDEDET